MTKTEQLTKQVKLDEIQLKKLRAQKRELQNQLRNINDRIRATKDQRRYHKQSIKTAQKMDIVEQALKDLR